MNSTSWLIIGIIALILVPLLSGWIVMISWNAVVPTIFGLTTITFGQALWLFLLCTTLFRSFPGSSK